MRFPRPALALLAASCSVTNPVPEAPSVGRIDRKELPPGVAQEVVELARSSGMTAFQIHVSEALPAHVHLEHDELVYIVSGHVRMRLGEKVLELAPGAWMHIPAGVVHGVDPYGPTTALSVFTPEFHGRDRFLVPDEER